MTKAEALQANEIYIHACEMLMQRVAELQEENNRLKETLQEMNHPSVLTRDAQDKLLEQIWEGLD